MCSAFFLRVQVVAFYMNSCTFIRQAADTHQYMHLLVHKMSQFHLSVTKSKLTFSN